jgi:protein involved in polysaccharide export with SLBB domain
MKQTFLRFLFFVALGIVPHMVNAQIPADLSKIKTSQITDAQLNQFLQQAQAAGMTESELIQEFQKRGLPEAEMQTLIARIKTMTGVQLEMNNEEDDNKGGSGASAKRKFKGETQKFRMPEKPSRVFGSELFSGADPLFVPNLKIATPKTYEIGPDDELQLDVYGNNISTQKLIVNSDGNVSVKYLGPVNLSGMTIEQATGVIKARLSKFYPSLQSGQTKILLSLGSVRSIQVIMVGAVKKPGTITLPSIATLFNALYASGGPLENGSFRNIELVRNSKVIAVADLYSFMTRGDLSANLPLRDNDVIRVPFAHTQVSVDGGLNRTGIFEMKSGESVSRLLDFAGGFRGNAFKGRITGTRFSDVDRRILDIGRNDFNGFSLMHGDSLYVDTVINRFQNRVFVTGAVLKPGTYALEDGLDIKGLLNKAQGLKEDAFLGMANMVRLRDDLSREYRSIDLRDIINGKQVIVLHKEDSLHVMSVLELKDSTTVTIKGPVKKPGDYRFEDSMSLKGLILQAGGLMENATSFNIEIGRRKKDIEVGTKGSPTSEIITVGIGRDLMDKGKEIILQPFDVVSVKIAPDKVKQVTVEVQGEVVYAGSYTLENPEERLSSIVKRAGGLLPYADLSGAKVIRRKLILDTSLVKRFALSNTQITETENSKIDTANLVNLDQLTSQTTEVALELSKILQNPGSDDDLTLQDGDILMVPRYVNTVAVNGEVLKQVTVQFQAGKGFGNYISAAGGYNRNAYKKRVFVVYPNGRSARTKSFLSFRVYPKVTPGSSIFIPAQPPRDNSFDPAKAGVLVSAFSAILTTLVLLFR